MGPSSQSRLDFFVRWQCSSHTTLPPINPIAIPKPHVMRSKSILSDAHLCLPSQEPAHNWHSYAEPSHPRQNAVPQDHEHRPSGKCDLRKNARHQRRFRFCGRFRSRFGCPESSGGGVSNAARMSCGSPDCRASPYLCGCLRSRLFTSIIGTGGRQQGLWSPGRPERPRDEDSTDDRQTDGRWERHKRCRH